MNGLKFDIAVWQTHVTEDECDIIIRTNTGCAFYCEISPASFRQSPQITKQYFQCLKVLRSGEEEADDFYVEDACDWLSQAFGPLVIQLAAPGKFTPNGSLERPSLSQYLFPQSHVCALSAVNDELHPYTLNTAQDVWGSPLIALDQHFFDDMQQWTRAYHPSDVEICYDNPQDVLIKPPTRVTVMTVEGQVTCFFKRLNNSLGNRHAKMELETLKKVTRADLPTDARICQLHGIVHDGNGVAGMLFPWINKAGVLSKERAKLVQRHIRLRWADQIKYSLASLHERGVIWGDAKAGNILIDKEDNAWIVNFGGSYTIGWVDKEKAGTVEGDLQGLGKILDMLEK